MEKISVIELSEGMILAQPVVCPQTKKVLLGLHTKLTDNLIRILKSRGVESVAIVDRYTLNVDPLDIINKELIRFLEEEIIRLAPERVEANTSDKMVKVSRQARKLSAKLLDDIKIVRCLVGMKVLDNDFLYRHCIGTCALSLLVASAMGLKENEILDIGAGALIHDLGMCEMPLLIRTVKRKAQEESLWKEHPKYGYYFALEAGFSEEIAKMILYHHESWNGEGFPEKLSKEAIPQGARIISVCQTYDQLLRLEGYPHHYAIEYLYGGGNYYFDATVVQNFTNNLAVYPLGSLVKLSTGETGVVVNVRKNLGPRPIVRVYFNRVNKPLAVPNDIDLGLARTVFIEKVL